MDACNFLEIEQKKYESTIIIVQKLDSIMRYDHLPLDDHRQNGLFR